MNNLKLSEDSTKNRNWLWVLLALIVVAALGFFGWNYLQKKPVATNTGTPGATSSASQNVDQDLAGVSKEISGLESNLSQLDTIKDTDDDTPSL